MVNQDTKHHMDIHTPNLVYWVIVVKGDEGESAALASLFVGDDINALDVTKFCKIVSQLSLLGIVLDASNKDLLQRHVRLGLSRVLKLIPAQLAYKNTTKKSSSLYKKKVIKL